MIEEDERRAQDLVGAIDEALEGLEILSSRSNGILEQLRVIVQRKCSVTADNPQEADNLATEAVGQINEKYSEWEELAKKIEAALVIIERDYGLASSQDFLEGVSLESLKQSHSECTKRAEEEERSISKILGQCYKMQAILRITCEDLPPGPDNFPQRGN